MRGMLLTALLALSLGVVAVASGSVPGQDARLSKDCTNPLPATPTEECSATGYVSNYTLVTSRPYTDATLQECSVAHGRQISRFTASANGVRDLLAAAIPRDVLDRRTFDAASGLGQVGELQRESAVAGLQHDAAGRRVEAGGALDRHRCVGGVVRPRVLVRRRGARARVVVASARGQREREHARHDDRDDHSEAEAHGTSLAAV